MTDAQLIYEALYFLPRGPQRHALEGIIDRAVRYERALEGISVCATVGAEDCARVARMVLNENTQDGEQ